MKNVLLALIVLLPAVAPAVIPPHIQAPPLEEVEVQLSEVNNIPPVTNEKTEENSVVIDDLEDEVALAIKLQIKAMEGFVEQKNMYYGQDDPGDLIDVEMTFRELEKRVGRPLETREILYIVIWSEYWLAVKGKTHALIGQEALARSYYQFCGEDGECTQEELMKFLSGYQPFFGNLAKVDMKHEKRADKLYEMLTNEFNYSVNGEEVYGYVDEILDVEFAKEKGWTSGKQWNRPSQWYGPSGPPPPGATVGSYTASYAIVCVKYGGGYFYFVTYGQEQTFTPTALP